MSPCRPLSIANSRIKGRLLGCGGSAMILNPTKECLSWRRVAHVGRPYTLHRYSTLPTLRIPFLLPLIAAPITQNVAHHWRRANDVQIEAEAPSRRQVHEPCWILCFPFQIAGAENIFRLGDRLRQSGTPLTVLPARRTPVGISRTGI